MSRRVYAGETTVSAARSRDEIDMLLAQRGATNFACGRRDGDDPPLVWFAFRHEGREVLLRIPLPRRDDPDIVAGPNGKPRTEDQQRRAREQRERSLLRALLLALRARFVAIDAGISTFDREFLGDFVTKAGTTIADVVLPAITGRGVRPLLDLCDSLPKEHNG